MKNSLKNCLTDFAHFYVGARNCQGKVCLKEKCWKIQRKSWVFEWYFI